MDMFSAKASVIIAAVLFTAIEAGQAFATQLVERTSRKSALIIPIGTILPVRLNTTISSAKNKPNQEITGRIMQDVPLSPGLKIAAGSKVMGHIVEVIPGGTTQGARVSVQFDRLIAWRQTIVIRTNLRAIAGFMRVREAQTPPIGPSESDVYEWLTTVQIGGDVIYGRGGVVTAADHPDRIVGKEVNGGVLGKVRAKEGSACRGAVDGNDQQQALWVFSSDACGAYGLEHVTILHAGRTEPAGMIVLGSDHGALKIPAGAGMLLRVNETSH